MHAILWGILSKVVEENGHIDILCNNAGIGPTDDVKKLVSTNLVSVYNYNLKKFIFLGLWCWDTSLIYVYRPAVVPLSV